MPFWRETVKSCPVCFPPGSTKKRFGILMIYSVRKRERGGEREREG